MPLLLSTPAYTPTFTSTSTSTPSFLAPAATLGTPAAGSLPVLRAAMVSGSWHTHTLMAGWTSLKSEYFFNLNFFVAEIMFFDKVVNERSEGTLWPFFIINITFSV